MKKLQYMPYPIVAMLVLIVMGFVLVSFIRSKTSVNTTRDNAMPEPDILSALSLGLAGFPDTEHLPVYPSATITFTKTEAFMLNHVTYQVEEPMDKVTEFYQKNLPKKGWVFQNSKRGYNLYNWEDPGGKLLWQMYLKVVIEMTLDKSKTVVYPEYGRYPNTE
jgi:hypothetical protein